MVCAILQRGVTIGAPLRPKEIQELIDPIR
jgi:hypothetical protein